MQPFANSPAMRSHLENQVNLFTELTHKSYDTLRRLSELNLRLAQQLIEDSVDTSRDLMNCVNPLQLTPTALRHAEPVAQHLRSYQQGLMSLLTGYQSEFARTAQERLPEASRSANAAAEEFAKNAAQASQAFGTRH